MSKSWDSSMVREMLRARRERDGASGARRTGPRACRPTSACRPTASIACPTTQAQEILQMRLQRLTGLEQDKIVGEYKRGDGADRRPARHPRHAGARHDDHRRRARRAEAGVRPDQARRAPQPDRAQRARSRHRRPDHADRHGRDALAHRLHQEPAALRVPRAEARRPRQAGDADQGRRLDRPALHRQHARLHPVLLEPRPRVLAQGLGSAAGLAQLARPADRQHVPAAGRREDQRRAAADRRASAASRPITTSSWRPRMGTVKKTSARRVQQPAQGRHHRGRPRRRATS